MVQVTPEPYNREEIDEMLDKKLNITDQIDAYTKQEDDALLLLKADKSELIDAYSKTEADELLALKLNITDQIDAYYKSEVDALISGAETNLQGLLDDKLNISDQIDAYSKQEDDALLMLKADKTDLIDAYTKQEADALLDEKLNITDQIDAYSKQEDDALLDNKLNITDQIDAYNKSEVDALLDDKLNISDQIDAYNKSEDDALLALKADKTELANYVDLQSAQTIIGTKQFGNISVSSISKLSKNDASILLAGGGDMLVSSLVSQPQLQEVRDIAIGRSKGYVFNTLQDLNDWMAVPDNVANLAIGDNLYIVDSQITDYWWDGTQLRELETQQPDLSNVVSSLGTATGGGNAITDLSLNGNILMPAKNKSFVDVDTDQSIMGQKSFTTTIHSVGITYQDYDNSNVILAGGGVRAIADIQSASYSKSEDDALLLLKADKTQLIDAYNRTETDQKLALKLNINDQIDAYSKTQDDALLLLKADKTQLIDAYSKTEADALFDDKLNVSDQIDAYSKTQDDALLLLKADKTQLADYVDLLSTQTITGQKQFNSNITAASFTKSGADDTVVLLGAGGTKPISEFGGGSVDDSNYVKKTGQILQVIKGYLRKSLEDLDGDEPSEEDEDYITKGEVVSQYVVESLQNLPQHPSSSIFNQIQLSGTSKVQATTRINQFSDKTKCADSLTICSSSLMISNSQRHTEGSGVKVSSNIELLRLDDNVGVSHLITCC
ncbi:MAG: hypothetical protein EZS28_032987 [Streblomastix strix]|uniref:Uncharacterized protein n=1 Tax=Streblomastix strix TaxID=222440 RepID=A0A5J4ULF3_9EUKA|nr:MAG: hypothetical protein EZS28_032987 [Streblomastix strix]